jgi:predicted transcriptional regulator
MYDPEKLKKIIKQKIRDMGYSMRRFTELHSIPRSPLMKAMSGAAKPSPESLEKWSRVLLCSPEERRALYHAGGHFTPEEYEAQAVVA